MKAKEYVEKLLARPYTEAEQFVQALCVVQTLITEAHAMQIQRKAFGDSALVAIQREQFSKWKSIVAGVTKKDASFAMGGLNLYPVMVLKTAPDLFLSCVQANAYLGMTMTETIQDEIKALRAKFIAKKQDRQMRECVQLLNA